MAEITELSNAPITEAIIDFRITPEREFPLNKLSEIKERIGKQYPQEERRDLIESSVIFAPQRRQLSQTTREKGLHGYFFKSEDGLNIAQFRVDGFTINRLKPYTSWEEIFAEAKRLWKVYVDIVNPKLVSRLAVRYINHLRFPLPIRNVSQYLTAPPQIPGDFPKAISSFLNRVVLVDEQTGLMANVTQAMEAGEAPPSHLVIIFDIDVYKRGDFQPGDPKIWEIFSDLREMKNRIFFDYITEETVELFK